MDELLASIIFLKCLFLSIYADTGCVDGQRDDTAMNPLSRWMLRQRPARSMSGFTLFELLITVIIVGILGSIALPTLIRHIGKSREVEAQHNLSAIGFAQQGYFFENREFATNYADLGVTFVGKYFDFPDPESIPGSFQTKSQAITKDNGLNGSHSYALGTYYVTNSYKIILCKSADNATVTQVPDDPNDDTCSNGGQRIE